MQSVAPSSLALANLSLLMSTAMMREAPAALQPMITERPTPPRPKTAQVEPASTYGNHINTVSSYPVTAQHLASAGEQKSQPALQEDALQENKDGHTMNAILRLGCEPELNHSVPQNHRRYSDSSCAGGKYYFSRNIPHPRMVCHIPGLNNVPVCIVRNSVLQEQAHADGTAIPKREASQERVLSGNAAGSSLASSYLPRLEAVVQRAPGSSQSVTQNREGLADVPKRTQSNPTSPEKLLKKRSQTSAQPAAVQGAHESLTQPSSPFANLTHSPYIQENVNFIPSYLDREIKVLEKLSKVLQTDSLTEIQNWLLRASLKEKDLMSNLIYSELADKDVLNNQPPAMKEGAAENTNIHCLLKPHPPPWRGPEREMNNRPSTKESEASQNMKHEKDAERIIFSRLRNRCPAHADTLSPGKNPGQQRAGSGNKRESCFHTPPNNRRLPSRAVPPPHSH